MSIEADDDPVTTTAGVEALPVQTQAPPTAAPSLARRAAAWVLASARRMRRADWIAVGLLIVAVVYRLYLIARGWPQLDSDEAVIGLMARHILHGEYPVFYWGQNYMGPFEAYFAALFFAVFGPSAFWLHVSVLLLTMGFLVAMYALASAAYGRVVGVITLAWLAVGPTMGVLRELKAIGGYQEMLLFGALILLGAWARLRQPTRLPQTRRQWFAALATYAGIGAAMGLGFWSDFLMLPIVLLAAFALIVGRPREVFSWLGLALVVAFVVAAYPYIQFNIVHPNATYLELSKMNHVPGQIGPFPPLGAWAGQTGQTLEVALPTILGSPYVCVTSGNIWSDYPSAMATISRTTGGACDVANLALSLGALALYLVALAPILALLWRWLTARLSLALDDETRASDDGASASAAQRMRTFGRRAYRAARSALVDAFAPERESPSPEARAGAARRAQLWLRLLLIGSGLATLLIYTTSRQAQTVQFTSARYLLLVYLSAPIFIGVLWGGARPVARWLASRILGAAPLASGRVSSAQTAPKPVGKPAPTGRRGALRAAWAAVASAALALLLALGLYGAAQTLAYANSSALFHTPMPVEDQQIIAFLGAHHIQAFYGDYWTCYRLAFESDERAICAVRGGDPPYILNLTANRYAPYIQTLAHTAHPAYIYLAHSPQDRNFAADATAQGLPYVGYQRVVIGDYAVYYYPG